MKRRTVQSRGHWAALVSLSLAACGNENPTSNAGGSLLSSSATGTPSLVGTLSGSSKPVGSASTPAATGNFTPAVDTGSSLPPPLLSSAGPSAASSAPAPVVVDPALIDDFEDGDALIANVAGRSGQWTAYNDATAGGTQTPKGAGKPEAGGAHASAFALHTTGSGFTQWGAGVQLDFSNTGGGAASRKPFNAGAYQGISFYAKGSGSVRVELPTLATTDSAGGGTCSTKCLDTHGQKITLSPDWTLITIPFAKVTQDGWGTAAAFDASSLLGLAFKVPGTTDAPAKFDFWVDDLKFTSNDGGGGEMSQSCEMGMACDGACTDTQNDPNHCGTCTTKCDADAACVSGMCLKPVCNPDKEQRSGHITTYNLATSMVACHYPTPTLPQYYGAMNEFDWNNSGVCGACVEITNTQNQKKVVVQITDECPLKGNEKWCTQGSHHIDLNSAAYGALGANNNPAVTWKFTPCTPTGNIKFYFDKAVQQFYLAVTPMNTRNLVKTVEVQTGGKFVALEHTAYNTYELKSGAGTGMLTFRLTDIYNHVVTDAVMMTADKVVDGSKQFGACP